MKHIFFTYICLIWCCLWNCYSEITEPVFDACDNYEHWYAEVRDKKYKYKDTMPAEWSVKPNEFFTPNGADYEDYDKKKYYIRYGFDDISCQSDNFEIEWNYDFNHGQFDSVRVVLSVKVEPNDDLSFLDQLKRGGEDDEEDLINKIEQTIVPEKNNDDVLRKTDYGNTKFVIKEGVVYFYTNGNLTKVENHAICRSSGFYVEFYGSGGKLIDVTLKDNDNGTSWYEDFSDCSNTNLFPRCPEPEPEELEVSAKIPTCKNSDFVLSAKTNLENIKWAGPDGFTAEGENLLIPYENAKSGCYIAYGKRDRCSEYVYEKICVEIPDLDVKTETNEVNICETEEYVWGDTVLTTSGTYTKHTTNPVTGCDKVEVVNLSVHKTLVELHETLCYGTTINFNGEVIGEAGDYSVTVRNKSNTCDSTTTLHVEMLPKVPYTYKDSTLCYGEYWTVAGYRIPTGRQVTLCYNDQNGCDSCVTFRAFGRPLDTLTLAPKYFCEDAEIEAFGNSYRPTKDTVIRNVTENEFGCPHYEYLPLKIVPSVNKEVDTILCYGEKLVMPNGDKYTRPTTFEYKYESINTGCDSIVTYNLSFREQDLVVKDTVFLCEEGGKNRLEKIRTFETNEYGCQRTIETPVLHKSISKTEQFIELCYGESVIVSTKEYTVSGEYQDTLTGSNGCDSIITTHLNVLPKREQILEEEIICTKDKTGRDTMEVATNDGENCPLYVRTPILYQSPKETTIDTTLCFGFSIEVAGNNYDATGNYEIHTTASNSCDSTIYLNLTVSDKIIKEIYDTICFEDVYRTTMGVYTETGDYSEIHPSATACDTIINIHLFKRERMEKVLPTILICEDDTLKPLDNDYTDTFTEVDEETLCQIHISQPYHYEYTEYKYLNKELCFEESHTDSRGTVYSTPGNYTIKDTTTALYGCLSILTTYLTIDEKREKLLPEEKFCHETKKGRDTLITKVNDGDKCPLYEIQPQLFLNPSYSTIDTTVCSGKIVTIEGKDFGRAGTYKVYSTAENGCDSVISLTINHIKPKETNLNINLCYGEKHTTSTGEYNQTGFYIERLSDANGCDSVVYLSIKVEPLVEKHLPSVVFCESDSIEYHGKVYTTAGTHIDTLYSNTGCPIYHYTEILTDPEIPYTEKEYNLCKGERRYINAYPEGMDGIVYSWYPSTYLENTNYGATYVSPVKSIQYTVTMSKGKCKNKGLVRVNVLERPKINKIDVDKNTQVATIIATGGKDMIYYCDELNFESTTGEISFENPGTYKVKVADETGCMDSLNFFYAPPVFPETHFVADSGGDDALWQVEGLEAYHNYQIWIYDRWGKLLIHEKDNFKGWDGVYNGQRMPSTDYWYRISIDLGEIEISGHFTLLRSK